MSRQQPDQSTRRVAAAIVGRIITLVVILAATIIGGVWRSPEVRVWAVEVLGPYQIINLKAALDDPSEAVAARACEVTFGEQWSWTQIQVYRKLYKLPSVALRCLDAVRANQKEDVKDDAEASSGEFTPVSRAQLAALRLGRLWVADLHEGRSDTCTTAKAAKRALEFAEGGATFPLLRCAVSASTRQARDCCIEELGGQEKTVELLEKPELISLMLVDEHYEELVNATFPVEQTRAQRSGSDDDEENDDRTADAKRERDGNDQKQGEGDDDVATTEALVAEKQDWVLGLGCRFHFEEPERLTVIRSFMPIIESEGCSTGATPWQGYYDLQSWSKVCAGMYTSRRTEQEMKPREALCDSLKYASIDEAIEVSKIALGSAAARAGRKADSEQERAPWAKGFFYSDRPSSPYVTSRARRSRSPSARVSTANRQILGSMGRALFR